MEKLAYILSSALSASAAVMYATLGELLSQKAGTLNLGLEGVMLVGAMTGFVVTYTTGSIALALLVTVLVGAALGLLFSFMTVTLRANQVVCGLALVSFGTGISGYLGKSYMSKTLAVKCSKIAIPFLSRIPLIGEFLFNQDILVYGLYLLVPLMYFFIYRTNKGLELRAIGDNPAAMDASGVNVFRARYIYTIIGTAIVALGGAYLTMAHTTTYTDNATAGEGWIASALVIFSFWNPLLAALGSLFFGLISIFALRLQLMGIPISSFFISMLPYISTILVLIVSATGKGRKLGHAPSSLGICYDRELR